jgi:hypothetical protein
MFPFLHIGRSAVLFASRKSGEFATLERRQARSSMRLQRGKAQNALGFLAQSKAMFFAAKARGNSGTFNPGN